MTPIKTDNGFYNPDKEAVKDYSRGHINAFHFVILFGMLAVLFFAMWGFVVIVNLIFR